ncbi:MAG: prolyl oligopeptidase family serine peptidase [Verrucomicrobiia bacterium]|jgi:dienelactone hydrolase
MNSRKHIHHLTLAVLLAVIAASVSAAAEMKPPLVILRTPGNIRFGVIGSQPGFAAPTLLVVAMSLEEMQQQPVFTEVARLLAKQGWMSVVIEPPCHGEDRRPEEPEGLAGWRHHLDYGEDVVQAFNAKARAVLGHVIAQGFADPGRLAICGTSRGGFLAFHFAAIEPRIKAVAGISPVTDLLALAEFKGTATDSAAEKLALTHIAPKLIGRPVWLSIGNNDERVDTDCAIAFTRAIVHASARQSKEPAPVIPVELVVAPSAGHRKINQAHEQLAVWLAKVLPALSVPPKNKETSKP